MLPSGHCPFLMWKMTFVSDRVPQMCQNEGDEAIHSGNTTRKYLSTDYLVNWREGVKNNQLVHH